ncbi:putative addiction module CopG family antidote [Enterovirga rhinocerotis]|uniref:Putative addiction module CopG family antidote n=2 Tax=Enterovirga rhinocerotis TaxID=1339210 RepID=A0A4R7C5N6_9HYPH|nr:putative addiction module CopG family antidote [Enterovirga rhinocerotis]
MPRHIHLSPELDVVVDRLLASGRYDSADALVGKAVSLLDDLHRRQDDQIAAFKAQIADGLADLAAGRTHDLDEISAELDDIIREHEARRDAAE